MAWWGLKNKRRGFHGNLLACLPAKVISTKFGSTFTQKTGKFGSIIAYFATMILPRKFRLTMTVLNPNKMLSKNDFRGITDDMLTLHIIGFEPFLHNVSAQVNEQVTYSLE